MKSVNRQFYKPVILPVLIAIIACQINAQTCIQNPLNLCQLQNKVANSTGRVSVKDYGAIGDGSDATNSIINALNTIANGGGTLLIPVGTYRVSKTIIVPSSVSIVGEGWNSSVVSDLDIPIFKTKDGASNVSFKDLSVAYTSGSNAAQSFQIEGINTIYMKISNVFIDAPVGRKWAGIRVWDGQNSNDTAKASGFMTVIQDSWIRQGVIWLKHSDSKIINNYIWSSETGSQLPYAIRIDNTANCQITGNDILPGKIYGGIYLYESYQMRIANNFFDGNGSAGIVTAWGIYGYHTKWTNIEGNQFWNLAKGGVFLETPHHMSVTNNVFLNNNAADATDNHDISVISNKFTSNGVVISNNVHNIEKLRNNPAKAVCVRAAAGLQSLSQVNNNTAEGYYAVPSFDNDRSDGRSSLSNNRTGSYLSSRSGQQTIDAQTEYAYVSFYPALDIDPAYPEINIQLTSPSGVPIPNQYILQNLSKNGFIIKFTTPKTNSITVNWMYNLK